MGTRLIRRLCSHRPIHPRWSTSGVGSNCSIRGLAPNPAVAIVGSRRSSAVGRSHAERFARELGAAGVTIVSGLAEGIDAAAHRGALGTVGSTVAVIGTGADLVYPRGNRELDAEIAATGAIVSEWPLQTSPRAANFPRRNRLIAALGAGVLVVEAAPYSGSLIQRGWQQTVAAIVYAIPGSIQSPGARGATGDSRRRDAGRDTVGHFSSHWAWVSRRLSPARSGGRADGERCKAHR